MADFNLKPLLEQEALLDSLNDDLAGSLDLSEVQQLEIKSYRMQANNFWGNSEAAPASRLLRIYVEGIPLDKRFSVTNGVITFWDRDELPPARYDEALRRISVPLHEACQPFVLEQLRAARKGLSFQRSVQRSWGSVWSE